MSNRRKYILMIIITNRDLNMDYLEFIDTENGQERVLEAIDHIVIKARCYMHDFF